MPSDLVIIGGGTAGLGAARAAVSAGTTPSLISDGPIGGDCTFTGCVPSKTLIAESRRGTTFVKALDRVASTIERIAATESADVLRSQGIEVVEGRASITAPNVVSVDGTPLEARRIIVSTGARPSIPPIPGLDAVPYRTNESFFEPRPQPRRLGIIGGGAIGCEIAMALAGFGCAVTVIEMAARLLPVEEPEASAVLLDSMHALGVETQLGAAVTRVDQRGSVIVLAVGDESIEVDELLLAAGRRPNVEGLGLDTIGVKLDARGYPVVDDKLRTTVRTVSAAGDVTGLLPFTHAAYEQGRLAAAHALRAGQRWRYDPSVTSWVIFTDPEVARLGMLEREAAAVGGRVAFLPLDHVDRAITDDRTSGFVKLIAAPKKLTGSAFGGRLVGATIVAPRAGEMIHAPALVARSGAFVGRLAQTTAPYPSWAMAVQQAAGQFFMEMDGLEARPAQV